MINTDVLPLVFAYLSYPEVVKCGRVCRTWHKASQNNHLWAAFYRREFEIEPSPESRPYDVFKATYVFIKLQNSDFTRDLIASGAIQLNADLKSGPSDFGAAKLDAPTPLDD